MLAQVLRSTGMWSSVLVCSVGVMNNIRLTMHFRVWVGGVIVKQSHKVD